MRLADRVARARLGQAGLDGVVGGPQVGLGQGRGRGPKLGMLERGRRFGARDSRGGLQPHGGSSWKPMRESRSERDERRAASRG